MAKRKPPASRSATLEKGILDRLSDGEPLAVICRSDVKFPHPTVWRDWCAADPDLAIAYAGARDVGADAIAAECLAIADDATGDVYIETDGAGVDRAKVDGDVIQRAKLRIETRLKLLAKWNPKNYGDKVSTEIGNKPGETLKVEGSADSVAIASALASALRDAKRGAQ
jgi:hypothetical protein